MKTDQLTLEALLAPQKDEVESAVEQKVSSREEAPIIYPTVQAPMLRQYIETQQKYADYLVLFQVGDFYEVFFESAKRVSEVLGIRLTSRDKNQADAVPMCGVPIHAIDSYLPRLLDAGERCVLVSQVEDAKTKGKGGVRREVTRILTPGVRIDGNTDEERAYQYVASVYLSSRNCGAIAYGDVSTGHIRLTETESVEGLYEALERIRPREIILPSTFDASPLRQGEGWIRTVRKMAREMGTPILIRPFQSVPRDEAFRSLNRLFCEARASLEEAREKFYLLQNETYTAIGGFVAYIDEISFNRTTAFAHFSIEESRSVLFIDSATRRNLEIEQTHLDGEKRYSLLAHMDLARTAMGSRCLKDWLLHPSVNSQIIAARHDAVGELCERSEALAEILNFLGGIRDLDRLTSRAVSGRANPYDLRQLGESLTYIPRIRRQLSSATAQFLQTLAQQIDALEDLSTKICDALAEEPPIRMNEGGIFRDGYLPELDQLRTLRNDARELILRLEAKEREASGITGLRIKYNGVFGYFFEISKANASKAPSHFERRQTLANAERFVTPELKKLESEILSAKDRQFELERIRFDELRSLVADAAGRLRTTAGALSELDAICSFARIAREKNYVRPTMGDRSLTKIQGGRHPVVESILGQHNFVPNDTELECSAKPFALLTGPNMGGKSTYLRQVGVIQLLAQAGSFVPARSAELGIVDRVFTRIGGGDDITRGDSTFMVEMREAATILRRATSRSMVLIDEIGRGTATADGLAIAEAIAEELLDQIECQTIFATHFHELIELASKHPKATSLSVGVIEEQEEIVFTHRIEKRPAAKSYGLEVARLAGLPEQVLTRANELLSLQFSRELTAAPQPQAPSSRTAAEPREKRSEQPPPQLRSLIERLRSSDTNRMTPIQALVELSEIREILGEEWLSQFLKIDRS